MELVYGRRLSSLGAGCLRLAAAYNPPIKDSLPPSLSFLSICSTWLRKWRKEELLGSIDCFICCLFVFSRLLCGLVALPRAAAITHQRRRRPNSKQNNQFHSSLRRNSSSSIIHFIHNWFHWTVPLGAASAAISLSITLPILKEKSEWKKRLAAAAGAKHLINSKATINWFIHYHSFINLCYALS